jgi:DNA-binding CsgD family transcriptional regulator
MQWLMSTATPLPVTPREVRRLVDLWRGGLPLERAARQAGFTLAEAQAILAKRAAAGEPGPAARAAEPGPTIEEFRAAYLDERLTAAQVAERYGMTVHQVRHRLEDAGVSRAPSPIPGEAVRLYGEGRSIREVAAELGIHHRDVWRHLDQAGVARRPRVAGGVVLSKRQLEVLYVRGGMSLAEVGRRFDVSPGVVARNLDRYGIPRHDQLHIDRSVLEQLYVDEGLGIRAVADRLGVAAGKVRRSLVQHGIGVRPSGRPPRSSSQQVC